ncbi:MAG: biotin--[acetyl-CoA-carboxylase] ligase [Verrucomicrobiota bacterium]
MSEPLLPKLHPFLNGSLKEDLSDENLVYAAKTESTNDLAATLARSLNRPAFVVVAAGEQTAGRGRRGDLWESPPERDLLFSIAIPLEASPELWPRLPHIVAHRVGEAIEKVVGPGLTIQSKWPNDLWVGGKKISGILIEMVSTPTNIAIVGCGVNVNSTVIDRSPSLAETSTSLYSEVGCETNRWVLLAEILNGLIPAYQMDLVEFAETRSWQHERSALFGRQVLAHTSVGVQEGRAIEPGPNGELRLQTQAGEIVTVISAEMVRLI